MDTLPIIPFGKHKGQPITKLLEDQKYLEWLKQQSWFKEKNPVIYNIVINRSFDTDNFKNQKTPEHNKLQNKFLDKEYLNKFYLKLMISKKWDSLYNDPIYIQLFGNKKFNTNTNKNFDVGIFNVNFEHNGWDVFIHGYSNTWAIDEINSDYDFNGEIDKIVSSRDYFRNFRDDRMKSGLWIGDDNCVILKNENIQSFIRNLPHNYNDERPENYFISAILEDNKLHLKYFLNGYTDIAIEIKPILGDDYPNVLRKMKNQIKIFNREFVVYVKFILLVDKFESSVTSKEQLIQIFALDGIIVKFFEEFS